MAATVPAPSRRWLYGPVPDLVFGAGLWYIAILLVFVFWGEGIRKGWGPILVPVLMLLTGTPHHGATLVRVYEHRRERRAYVFFTVWLSAIIWVAFAFGVHNLVVGSWIVTLFITWSPWHYTGQNYGVTLMFLRRAGVPISANAKRLLYGTFVLSYALTFVSMHSGVRATDYVPLVDGAEGYEFYSLGIPEPFTIFSIVAVLYAAALIASGVFLARKAPIRDLLPGAITVLSQGLWFSIPVLVSRFGVSSGVDAWQADADYYFLWVGVAHAVQYLWVTSYYARNEGDWSGQLPYFTKVFLAGAFVWVVPGLLFAPDVFGRVSWSIGLAGLVAACVNLQHFVLDGAIWKLRDGRVARALIRTQPPEESTTSDRAGAPWLRAAIAVVGAFCIVLLFSYKWEEYFGVRMGFALGNVERVQTSTERLRWMGRDDANVHLRLGQLLAQRRRYDEAANAYRRSIEIAPNGPAWSGLGGSHAAQEHWDDALAAYESGLALDPNFTPLLKGAAEAALASGDSAAAVDWVERALAREPDRRDLQQLLDRARRGSGAPAE